MNNIYSLLGLAYRAGKIVWGYQAVVAALRSQKVELVLLARDGSPGLKTRILRFCQEYRRQGLLYGYKNELGAALGKPPCAVVGITDKNFAVIIRQRVREVDV
ncbi:L7Ae/L30e/S12e/Gadd45 family ribosomal protein [Neomoorella thermoacetica]|uniref:L7Ae/L30e/S12e/Gadd45 family ribosomal protein n=1 Tax=Neomoorella thermoacetica TaxID=1525 RepID=UPI0008FAFC71|nr:L7Ae/L30e/S12e/Gadd45 family ribosomal protein [Moorella thermoacetica]OIQ56181.1 putative ribosomal protein YlxQ [Moorella thermoacetica]